MKTMDINGVVFEVQKPSSERMKPWFGFQDIHEAYKRPSDTKVSIYNMWERWFAEVDTIMSGVIASSSNFYTHGGIIRYLGKEYNIRITYAHNYISEII